MRMIFLIRQVQSVVFNVHKVRVKMKIRMRQLKKK
jgi:hypothetical protein